VLSTVGDDGWVPAGTLELRGVGTVSVYAGALPS
jgi:hypothetical protein